MNYRKQHVSFHTKMAVYDDVPVNKSAIPLLAVDLSRRQIIKGSLNAAILGFFSPVLSSNYAFALNQPYIGFTSIQPQTDPLFDNVIVPEGYSVKPFFSWGDPVVDNAPIWRADASNSWHDQLKQAGDNHDGMHFFAFAADPDRGLMVINHEYTNPTLHPNGITMLNGSRPLDDVKKEQAAHGVSVIEVQKNANNQWQRVYPSAYNRRISAMTPMRISGPLAGHELMKTHDDPDGLNVLGTLNNCSSGFTPWGTYLICEENWHNYFVNRDSDDYKKRVSHHRYGIANGPSSHYYSWETVDQRFDATPQPELMHNGFVHEPNRFGWVVEVDPFDPTSTPIKRTAFGRFCREGVALSITKQGQMAFYSGDDTRGEYIYKFVPRDRFDVNQPSHNRDLLDEGTLYAARFNDDGSGKWLALRYGNGPLTVENGFKSQAEVLVNARAAADLLGATPMDRPEWATVHPHNRDVYVSLTNNSQRGKQFALNAANPRPNNQHGHIIKIMENDADPTAIVFDWELFLIAGEHPRSVDQHGDPVAEHLIGAIQGDIFSSPDGLGFDNEGRLWILTDYDDDKAVMHAMGCNQMLCANPISHEVKRFLVGPRGCEITGLTWSPDYKAMWVNIQHPGISFPASDGKTRPRSTTVLITKNDGGQIGT